MDNCKILGYSYKIAVPETVINGKFFEEVDRIFSNGGYIINSIGKWEGRPERVGLYCKSYNSRTKMYWDLIDILDCFLRFTDENSVYVELTGERSMALLINCDHDMLTKEFEQFLNEVFEML